MAAGGLVFSWRPHARRDKAGNPLATYVVHRPGCARKGLRSRPFAALRAKVGPARVRAMIASRAILVCPDCLPGEWVE